MSEALGVAEASRCHQVDLDACKLGGVVRAVHLEMQGPLAAAAAYRLENWGNLDATSCGVTSWHPTVQLSASVIKLEATDGKGGTGRDIFNSPTLDLDTMHFILL